MAKKQSANAKEWAAGQMAVWSLRMPAAVVAAVKRAAKAERKTASDIVREALAKRLPAARKAVGK